MSSNRRVRRRELSSGLDSLEGRELMTGGGIYGLDGKYINKFDYRKLIAKRENPPAPPSQRRVDIDLRSVYGGNARAVITLYGPGSLQTPKVDANGFPVYGPDGMPEFDPEKSTRLTDKGMISILFDGTTSESQIVGMVYGTRQRPQIDEIRDVDAGQFDTTGVGTNQMGYVNLNRFDLGRGGRINFTAGVQRIFLNDIKHGTQIDVAALKTPPLTSPQNPGGLGTDTVTSNSGSTAVSGGGTTTTTTTTVNGITIITTLPTTDQITISNGELTGVGGLIVPGAIPSTQGNTRVEVQGVELIFRNVLGRRNLSNTPDALLGRAGKEQIAGVIDNGQASDNVRLTFFNIQRDPNTYDITSAVRDTQGINDIVIKPPKNIPGISQNAAITPLGSGVAEYETLIEMPPGSGTYVKASAQIVGVGYSLVDDSGKTRYFVNAYDVISRTSGGSTTSPEWYFEVVDPKTGEPFPFDALGGSSGDLYITRSGNAVTGNTGLTQGLDTQKSLFNKVSETLGNALNYPSTFNSKGGTAGVSGVSFIYTAGLSYFSAWNPENPDPQLGIMKIAVSAANNLSVSSTTRTGGAVAWDSDIEYVMGSVDQNVVVINPATKSSEKNQDGATVTYYAANMFDSNTLAGTGSFKLYVDANQTLGGLSESFFPEALGAAVIDVRGNLRTFSATKAQNMVLNVNGIASYVRSNDTSNSTIIGHPILHLAVGRKPGSNVTILSSSRPTDETPGGLSRPGTRGGVKVIKDLPIIGPIVNPLQGSPGE